MQLTSPLAALLFLETDEAPGLIYEFHIRLPAYHQFSEAEWFKVFPFQEWGSCWTPAKIKSRFISLSADRCNAAYRILKSAINLKTIKVDTERYGV